jgi:hypothetical protein
VDGIIPEYGYSLEYITNGKLFSVLVGVLLNLLATLPSGVISDETPGSVFL